VIFNQLTTSIRTTSDTLRSFAGKAINQFLTVRNWLIGYYIVEFEQKGEDRAQYGEKLLETLAKELNENSLSYRNLNLYRQFFQTYPQIAQEIPAFLQKNNLLQIRQSLTDELQNTEYQDVEILQSLIAESDSANLPIRHSPITQFNSEDFLVEPQRLLSELSYTHLVQQLNRKKLAI
jgi:hypothetical protein